MNFQRHLDINKALEIGITSKMWFGTKTNKHGIEKNDGDLNMWISESFAERILEKPIYGFSDFLYLRYIFNGRYSRSGIDRYVISYRFKYAYDIGAFFVAGHSGDFGFNMGQTKRHTLGKRTRKSLYNQLYNHLLELTKI